jgi:hypothetical protein
MAHPMPTPATFPPPKDVLPLGQLVGVVDDEVVDDEVVNVEAVDDEAVDDEVVCLLSIFSLSSMVTIEIWINNKH